MTRKGIFSYLVFAMLLMSWTTVTQAGLITFDDLTPGDTVTNQYAGQGATFTGSGSVNEGLTNGDAGNWGLDGTNGPYFYGIQADNLVSISFDSPISMLSLDTSRSNGSDVGNTFTLEAYYQGGLIDSQKIVQQDINVWTTVSVNGGFDEVQLTSADGNRPVYGVDNIVWEDCVDCRFNVDPIPTMSIWGGVILGAVLGLFALARLRRTI